MNFALTPDMTETKPMDGTNSFRRYSSQLLRFIRSKVNILEDAEDILQDVWYQYSLLANPGEINSVSGWLYSVARNKITDRFRKKKNVLLDDLIFESEDGAMTLKDILLVDENDDAVLNLLKEEFWEALQDAMNELPENQRKVFILNELEDKTLQEIADMENVPLKTIISRKGYAVKALRRKLDYLRQEFY
jgi:RNA polymerase sigma factor (sigma-70 family)